MPCYLFTFHAYRSWMPDRKRGYVRRGQGILPSDAQAAKAYRHRATQEEAIFDEAVQSLLVDAAIESCASQDNELYFAATEKTHIHLLDGWRNEKEWKTVRRGLRSSLSRRLRNEIEKRDWLSSGCSRKRVKDRKHYEYLVEKYLPRHSGWKWSAKRGKFR